jgi:hypothetical protein
MIQPFASIVVATLCWSEKVTVMEGADITSAWDTVQ